MKLVTCNGDRLEVRDLGPVLLALRRGPTGIPIKLHGRFILEDAAARDLVRQQLDVGLYEREREP